MSPEVALKHIQYKQSVIYTWKHTAVCIVALIFMLILNTEKKSVLPKQQIAQDTSDSDML